MPKGSPRSKRPYATKPCENCGTPYGPTPQTDAGWRWSIWDRSRYCSRQCGPYVERVRATIEGRPRWEKGYVYVVCAFHPRAHDNGYVYEHILIMERKLGRYLLPGENVHHINGVRDDNRPENLELWISWQPPRQRVSDLVGYAREILDRYGTPDTSEMAQERS